MSKPHLQNLKRQANQKKWISKNKNRVQSAQSAREKKEKNIITKEVNQKNTKSQKIANSRK